MFSDGSFTRRFSNATHLSNNLECNEIENKICKVWYSYLLFCSSSSVCVRQKFVLLSIRSEAYLSYWLLFILEFSNLFTFSFSTFNSNFVNTTSLWRSFKISSMCLEISLLSISFLFTSLIISYKFPSNSLLIAKVLP